MTEIVYNVPASRADAYREHPVIVRSRDPLEWIRNLPDDHPDNVVYLQLLSLSADLDPLMHWGEGIPLELVAQNPTEEFPLLYQCSNLLDRHPVRVSIPLTPGFGSAVKLAVSLQFAVRLRITRPDLLPIDELIEVLNVYLHHSTTSQPIDFFHSLFFAFHNSEPVTLWEIQEEDPAYCRFIDDQGDERLPGRLAESNVDGDKAVFLETVTKAALADQRECSGCTFFDNCAGYFKWPNPDYCCDGVKSLFQLLRDAASELTNDLDRYQTMEQGLQS